MSITNPLWLDVKNYADISTFVDDALTAGFDVDHHFWSKIAAENEDNPDFDESVWWRWLNEPQAITGFVVIDTHSRSGAHFFVSK